MKAKPYIKCAADENQEYPLKNYRLAQLRVSRGITQEEMAEFLGVSNITYCAIENLRTNPSKEKKSKLSKILGVDEKILFPESAKACRRQPVKTDVYDNNNKVGYNFNKILVTYNLGEEADFKELQDKINYLLEKTGLSYRERELIRLRYGFYGEPTTLEETAKRFKVTRDRVRQIEARVIRKLQHPVRYRKLVSFMINK